MDVSKYVGNKFKDLRDKERKSDIYKNKSVKPVTSIKPPKVILKNLEGNSFVFDYDLGIIQSVDFVMSKVNPSDFDGIVTFKNTCECGSSETKKVYYTQTKAYKMCLGCKADLGDFNEN